MLRAELRAEVRAAPRHRPALEEVLGEELLRRDVRSLIDHARRARRRRRRRLHVPAAALGARRRGAGGAVARPLALVDGSSAVAAAAAAATERAAERARVDGRAGQRGPLGEARQVRRALGGRARREEHRERLGVARQRRLVDRRAPAGVALRRRRARAQQLVDEADGADERRHVERAVAARVDVRRLPRLAAQHLGQHRAHLRLEREDVLVPQQRAPHVGPPERARDVAGLDAVHPVEERVRHGVRVRRRRERRS